MREPYEGLGAAYACVPHDPRDFDAAHTLDREKHLLDLGAPQLFGRVHEQVVDVQPSTLEVTFGRGPGEAYPVGLLNIKELVYHRRKALGLGAARTSGIAAELVRPLRG